MSPDLQISWFWKDREITQSDTYSLSQFGETCQLDISKVLPDHEGEYSCVARNSAGMATCAATLTVNGEFCLKNAEWTEHVYVLQSFS